MKNRINAALAHLVFSATLISLVVGFTILHFYPGIFFNIENTSDALKILIPADIVLGPLLTFIIYVKGKRGLRFDLICIVICQIAAMLYGCWSIYEARPGYLAFHGDAFYIVPPRVDQSAVNNPSIKVGKLAGPKIVMVNLPGNSADRFQLAMQSVSEGIPVHWKPEYYDMFNGKNLPNPAKASIQIGKLNNISEKQRLQLEQLSGNFYLFPVAGTRSSQIIAVNKTTLEIHEVLPIFPF
jgi:hypothetical protein